MMAGPAVNGSIDEQQYIAVVERTEELARLKAQVQRRKPILVFGTEAVGKTRLLRSFVQARPLALFAAQVKSPRDLLLTLVGELRRAGSADVSLPADCRPVSTGSLKGMVQRALDRYPFFVVLDHLAAPSRAVTGLIKDLSYFDRTAVVFAARSPHMEDIGALRPLCAGRPERLEVKEFPPAIAFEFARREAIRTGLWASNLDTVLAELAAWSRGNPGSILAMLKMAQLPRYRTNSQIKAHVLYLDYRMGRRE